jgi:hypothetical protein
MGVRRMIFYGFDLSWINSHCIDGWYVNNHGHCVLEGNLLQRIPLLQKKWLNIFLVHINIILLV